MAPLCASNQPHSVYPHTRPRSISVCAPPLPIHAPPPESNTCTTALHSTGPDAGAIHWAAAGCLSINLGAIRRAEEEEGGLTVIKKWRWVWGAGGGVLWDCHEMQGSLVLEWELMGLPSAKISWGKEDFAPAGLTRYHSSNEVC